MCAEAGNIREVFSILPSTLFIEQLFKMGIKAPEERDFIETQEGAC